MSEDVPTLLRAHYAPALARLARQLRDVPLAEDALQEAVMGALTAWPQHGVPDHPVAWLARAGLNHYRDARRRRAVAERHAPALEHLAGLGATAPCVRDLPWDDSMLQLICTCCEPALGALDRVTLTLSMVAGFSVREIAGALLSTPAAVERRLSRAKGQLREAVDEPELARSSVLEGRLPDVIAVIRLVFNEGYWSRGRQGGESPIRAQLVELALSLASSLYRASPAEPEVAGLLSLLLLHRARLPARLGPDGRPLDLEHQDRSLWHSPTIDEACALLREAMDQRRPGPLQIEAAIAAVHAAAPRAEDTDWLQISLLYEALERHVDAPAVRVQRAFAVGMALSPREGLALLASVADHPRLSSYPYLYLVEAELRGRAGEPAAAHAALQRALACASNAEERLQIEAKIAALEA